MINWKGEGKGEGMAREKSQQHLRHGKAEINADGSGRNGAAGKQTWKWVGVGDGTHRLSVGGEWAKLHP